jgi:hypothetical protein
MTFAMGSIGHAEAAEIAEGGPSDQAAVPNNRKFLRALRRLRVIKDAA